MDRQRSLVRHRAECMGVDTETLSRSFVPFRAWLCPHLQ
jgi:hypothetical protein